MLFRLNINLDEDYYLAYNIFHALESAHGRKNIRKIRILFTLAMVCLSVLYLMITELSAFSVGYVILLGLFTVLYVALFKKILRRNIKAQIKRMKKIGKLPFEADTVLEFHEDKLVAITPSSRTEQSYDIFERMCVTDRFILLHKSSISAYILPVAQITTQLNPKELLDFLAGKCPNVEYY